MTTETNELHWALAKMQVLMTQAADRLAHYVDSLAESHTKDGIVQDVAVQLILESEADLIDALRAAALPWDQRHKRPQGLDPQTGDIAQKFEGLPLRKLKVLLTAGWAINGVSIERTIEDGTTRRVAVTTGGMVLWWNRASELIFMSKEDAKSVMKALNDFDGWADHGCPPSTEVAVKIMRGAMTEREPTDCMGMPLSCGKPLCAPGDHHPLCKLATPPAQPAVPLTDDAVYAAAEIAWRAGWVACRDAEFVGEEAEDDAWGYQGATVANDIKSKLREKNAAQPAVPYGWVRMNPGFNSGVFHLGTECPPGWVGGAVPVSKIAAPEKGGAA